MRSVIRWIAAAAAAASITIPQPAQSARRPRAAADKVPDRHDRPGTRRSSKRGVTRSSVQTSPAFADFFAAHGAPGLHFARGTPEFEDLCRQETTLAIRQARRAGVDLRGVRVVLFADHGLWLPRVHVNPDAFAPEATARFFNFHVALMQGSTIYDGLLDPARGPVARPVPEYLELVFRDVAPRHLDRISVTVLSAASFLPPGGEPLAGASSNASTRTLASFAKAHEARRQE